MNFSFKNKKLKIVEKFIPFICLSLAIIIAGLIFMGVKGMNLGVEFSGGSNIQVTVHNVSELDANDFKSSVKSWLAGDRDGNGSKESKEYSVSSNVQTSGKSTYEFRIGTTMKVNGDEVDLNAQSSKSDETLLYEENAEIKEELKGFIEDYIAEKYSLTEDKFSVEVEPHVIGNDVKNYTVRNAFIAVAVAVVVVLIYIAIRFTVLAGISAIFALLHDVLIMVALTTIFQIPVNSTFIAAVITIVGYSINATIVVFDRVRELQALPSNLTKTDKEIANEAIAGTLSRSILTTITTLVMIVILAIFGSAIIREFAYPIVFGLLAGLYSSALLSASFWVYLRKLFGQENKKPTKKVKKVREQVEA